MTLVFMMNLFFLLILPVISGFFITPEVDKQISHLAACLVIAAANPGP